MSRELQYRPTLEKEPGRFPERPLHCPDGFGVSTGWQNRPLRMLKEMRKSPYYQPIRMELNRLIRERGDDETDYRPTAGGSLPRDRSDVSIRSSWLAPRAGRRASKK